MACIHKFALDLNLSRLTFEPTTLIVGTFNPSGDNLGNYSRWFYGRTRNNYFWDVLPRLYGQADLRSANRQDWKAFCKAHRIALTDLIHSIDDADENNPAHIAYLGEYRDDRIAKQFKRFTYVDIPEILNKHNSIKHVYLTRSVSDSFWRQRWQPVVSYCEQQGIKEQCLLTPSGGARFKMPKGEAISLRDFILREWQNDWSHK